MVTILRVCTFFVQTFLFGGFYVGEGRKIITPLCFADEGLLLCYFGTLTMVPHVGQQTSFLTRANLSSM